MSGKNFKINISELDQEIQKLSIQNEILLAYKSLDEDDKRSFIVHLSKAVDYGFVGDYGFIGAAYGGGLYGLEVDLDKGKYYLQKFYEDYKNCKLQEVSADSIIVALFNLAAIESYICERDGLIYSKEIIARMTGLYKEIIVFAENVNKSLAKATIMDVFNSAVILYSGNFDNQKGETIMVPADKSIGAKGLKLAAKWGCEKAKEFIVAEDIK